ncbi:MAG: ImmA/IrrE family metallo-endopeptidase [Gemmatimonadota bacterium]
MDQPKSPASEVNPEAEATRMLKRFQLRQIPVPVEEIAQRLGLRLQRSVLGDDVAGVLLLEEDQKTGVIGVNVSQAPVRQRFTIAHEIAHFVLHRNTLPIFIDRQFLTPYFAAFRSRASSTGADRLEREANAFAAALLMPAPDVRRALAEIEGNVTDEEAIEQLARRFDVSRQAMTFRVANIVFPPADAEDDLKPQARATETNRTKQTQAKNVAARR